AEQDSGEDPLPRARRVRRAEEREEEQRIEDRRDPVAQQAPLEEDERPVDRGDGGGEGSRAGIEGSAAERAEDARPQRAEEHLDREHREQRAPRAEEAERAANDREEVRVDRLAVEDRRAAPPTLPSLDRCDLLHPVRVLVERAPSEPVAGEDLRRPVP